MTPPARRCGDSGSITVELVILAPLTAVLLAAVVLVGRVQSARADLEGAARSAARELSIARDPAAAVPAARELAEAMVEVGSPTCRSLDFESTVDADAVEVTLRCRVDLEAASLLPVPGSMTVEASASEVVDRFREDGT